jgi:hypothetical protein
MKKDWGRMERWMEDSKSIMVAESSQHRQRYGSRERDRTNKCEVR